MKLAPLVFHAPTSLSDATGLLAEYGDDAKVLAGGQSLIPVLSYRLADVRHLVDITRVDGLSGYTIDDDGLRIRAGTTQREIEKSLDIELAYPLLHEAVRNIAHAQIRNRGTVCGSLAHADPAAELPAAMVALSATMVAESASGRREIPAADFFMFHLTTALDPTEVLVEVRVPRSERGTQGAFLEVAHRKGDFALAGVAASVRFDSSGSVVDSHLVCSGVGPRPFRASQAEDAIRGSQLADDALLEAQEASADGMEAADDIHASASYRRHVAGVLVRRCLATIRSAPRSSS